MAGTLGIKLTISAPGKWSIEVTKAGEITLTNLADGAIEVDLSLEELKLWLKEE